MSDGKRTSRCFKAIATSIAAVLLVSSVTSSVEAAPAAPPFPDMEKSWFGYQESVSYLVKKGSINGYPDGLFHPKDTVNRAEFLKLVFRSRGHPEPVTGDCFADVAADAWYAPYVCAAKRRGMVSGYTLGARKIFRPEQPILFAEAIKMVLLAYGAEITEGQGNDWFQPYVDELDDQNIMSSWSYIPWQEISRERAADLIARYVRATDDRAITNMSAGCGKAERPASLVLPVYGQDRSYLLHVAENHTRTNPSPLIVAFHGRTNSNEQVRNYFGLDRAAKDSFVAYPAGISNGNGSFSWSDPGNKITELRDYAFFDAIVKEVSDTYCIDMDRIYVVGHSLGAWFANSVACARGGIVRASATVGGSTTMTNCSGPSAAMIINNPKDASSPQKTSENMRDTRITTNKCEFSTEAVDPAALSCQMYVGCPKNPVVFCPHTIDNDRNGYYPHLWPPGTGEAIQDFFRTLPRTN